MKIRKVDQIFNKVEDPKGKNKRDVLVKKIDQEGTE
jgi:hypothetical protein